MWKIDADTQEDYISRLNVRQLKEIHRLTFEQSRAPLSTSFTTNVDDTSFLTILSTNSFDRFPTLQMISYMNANTVLHSIQKDD